MRLLVSLCLRVFAFISSCGNIAPSKEFTVSGTISNASDKYVYLDEFPIDGKPFTLLDSAKINSNGKYSLRSMTKENSVFYRVRVSDSNWVIIYVIPGDAINLSGDYGTFGSSYVVKGSAGSQKLKEFLDRLRVDNREVENMNSTISQYEQGTAIFDSLARLYNGRYTQLMEAQRDYKIDFLQKEGASPIAVYALGAFNPKDDYAIYNEVLQKFKKEKPTDAYGKMLEMVIKPYEAEARLQKGAVAPDLKLAKPDGGEMSISELKGHYVLIDFWASWCGPCRRENPNVVALYNKYHPKGFEIMGVSLDSNRDKWIQAIEADKLTWNHISDLKGWQSVAAQTYMVSSIPQTILIDPQGKIVEKGLRGPSLEQKLKEIYGF